MFRDSIRLFGALALILTPTLAAPAEKKLGIVRVALSESEDGPALPPSEQFRPGENIYFSCLVEGYRKSEKLQVYLSYTVEVRDSKGVLTQASQTGKLETTVSPEDKEWLPKLRETIVVPPLADSGEYKILVKVTDEFAKADVEAHGGFQVKGHDVAPSDTLVVRNFRFLRGEDDEKPLTVAAYRPGDALWARFDMTGYKLGAKNTVDIEYGLVVLRSDGSSAYSEPQAATQREQSFYPQRYQPGVLNLTMPKDIATGPYTIVLSVRDNIGKQTYETREKFSIE